MVSSQRKRLQFKRSDNSYMTVEVFIAHNLSAPHKWGTLELKEKYAIVIPWSCNQEVCAML